VGSGGLRRQIPADAAASLMGTSHLDFSLRIGAQVSTFRARAQLSFTPPSCRMSSGQQSGRPPDLSRVNDFSPVSTSSIRFRHIISGLLALVSRLFRNAHHPGF